MLGSSYRASLALMHFPAALSGVVCLLFVSLLCAAVGKRGEVSHHVRDPADSLPVSEPQNQRCSDSEQHHRRHRQERFKVIGDWQAEWDDR